MAAREELRVLDDAVQKLQDYLWGGAEQEEGIRVPTHGKLEELEALASAAALKGGEVLQKGEEAKVLVQAMGARAQAHHAAGLLAWAKGDGGGALRRRSRSVGTPRNSSSWGMTLCVTS